MFKGRCQFGSGSLRVCFLSHLISPGRTQTLPPNKRKVFRNAVWILKQDGRALFIILVPLFFIWVFFFFILLAFRCHLVFKCLKIFFFLVLHVHWRDDDCKQQDKSLLVALSFSLKGQTHILCMYANAHYANPWASPSPCYISPLKKY